MAAEITIVYQVRGVGRLHVSDNGAELDNGDEVARRDSHGRWKITPELGSTERLRVYQQLCDHDRTQGIGTNVLADLRPGLRGGR